MKTLIFVILLAMCSWARTDTWLHVNGLSQHDQAGYNQVNAGIGIETDIMQNWTASTGIYRNSVDRNSAYVYARRSWYSVGGWDLGTTVGVVSGYPGWPVAPMAFPEVCWHWACAMYLPAVGANSVNTLGLHARIPIK
jgi:hypothetical protein